MDPVYPQNNFAWELFSISPVYYSCYKKTQKTFDMHFFLGGGGGGEDKLPSYLSPNPTFSPKWEVSVNVE